MNLIVNHIPPNWKPGNHKAIAKWMERLPGVRDFDNLKTNDDNYDKRKAHSAI